MAQAWKNELRAWARRSAEEFQHKEGVLGVVIGGSLARQKEWRHSDLELGILLAEKNPALPYFNIRENRGVEAIQLVRGELEAQVSRAENGDLSALLHWPIQLWTCRIVDDPSGLLARFKAQFDAALFSPPVIECKLAALRESIAQKLAEARELTAAGRPCAALVQARWAFNETILAVHWAHGELPRSQSRTDSRLRWLCRKHGLMPFYDTYRRVFDLEDVGKIVHRSWPKVRQQALELTRLWGDSTREFFIHAVDGDFQWRQNAGILTVYRLFIPIVGRPGQGIFDLLDDPDWSARNQELKRFLGLSGLDQAAASDLIAQTAACRRFYSPSSPD